MTVDFRERGANLFPLDRIVIEKSQGIDADVQLLRDFAEVLRLVSPVDAHRGEMRRLRSSMPG